MRRVLGLWLLLAMAAPRAYAEPPAGVYPGPPNAVDLTDVASSFDVNNKFDFRFRVRYDHTEKRAQIKREMEGPGQQTIDVFKDLVYSQSRDSLALRAEVGLYHDLMLSFELPLVLQQQSIYGFDQSLGSSCSYPPAMTPTCVNASNSTTVNDGIVPAGGYDATQRGLGTTPPVLFRGASRGARGGSGLDAFDTFNVGLTWAPMSQARDDTKPTWVVLVQGEFSIGNIMAFDRANPDANHAVSEGVHRLFIRTALSKRIIGRSKWLEPYWGLWYMLPIARGDSLFIDYGAAEKVKTPQMQAGTVFGAAFIPFDRPEKNYQVSLDVRGRVEGHFNGQGYSEAWELLAGSPALACDAGQQAYNPNCPAYTQANMANPSQKGDPSAYTGIDTIENYASLGAEFAVQAQIGKYFRLRSGFNYQRDESHLITGADIGTPMNGSGRVMNPNEFNPAYRPLVDLVGRRYLVDNVDVYNFYLWAQLMF